MATTAIKASGTLVHVGILGDGSDWFKLGMLKKVAKPTRSVGEIDATDMDSTAKEFIADLADFGESAMTLNWKPGDATDTYLENWGDPLIGGNAARSVRITTPNGKTYIFLAFIKSYGADLAVGSLLETNLTLRVTGDVTRNF
jgi:hypothetical protein